MPRVRLPEGELRDEIRQPLFDSIFQAVAESPIATRSFFSSVQGKSKAFTNLRQNNLLEATVSYRVQGLALDTQNQNEVNRLVASLMMERSYLSLKIGEKEYWNANGTYVAGRMNQTSAITRSSGTGEAAGTLVERVYQKYGDAAVQGVAFAGKHVIDIPPLQSFRADWVIDPGNMTATEITNATPTTFQMLYIFSLKGLQRRPVQ